MGIKPSFSPTILLNRSFCFTSTMFEVEMKVKVKNIDQLLEILNKRAKKDTRFENIDIYYNTTDPTRDFSKTDEAIRVRITRFFDEDGNKTSESADLTYKGPKLDKEIKTRVEKVVKFVPEDIEALDSILSMLGLKKVLEIKKDRQLYHINHKNNPIEIVVDCVEHLPGYYMELELQCADRCELESSKEIIIDLLKEFGYGIEDSIRESYLELILKAMSTSKKYLNDKYSLLH